MANLTEGKIGKTLAIYSLPILLSNLLLQTFVIVEALLLGSQGKASLAAVGAVSSLIALVQSLPISISALFAVPAVAVGLPRLRSSAPGDSYSLFCSRYPCMC